MNNFAISSDGIATALQDSASSLMAAGNNLEQSVAMIAAANKVLQDPNSVGAALRTISLRIRGTSVKVLEEMGEETDGVIESVSKLQAKVKALSGVDILTDTGAYKDTYTIIKEIAQVWDQMNDIDRAALLELLAGKNRSNAMAAMLTNLEDLEGAYESAMEAQGSAEAENEKYMNSIQGKIELFTNSLQVMWQNAISSEFVKFIVSLGTSVVRLVDQIGMIPSVLAGIVAFKGFSSLVKNFGDIKAAISLIAEESIKTGKTIFEVSDSVGLLSLKTKLASSSLVEFAVKNGLVQASEISTMTTTQLLSVAFQGLTLKIKAAVKAMLAFIKANPWIAIAAAVAVAITAIAALTKTHKDYLKKLKETSDEISDVKNNIKSLNDELKTTQDRIDELNSKDKLSFTEKEELKNLKAQNAELERSIRLEEQKEKRLQKKASDTLNNAVKSDYMLNGKATVYKNSNGEYVAESVAVDQSANNYAANNKKLNDGYSSETVSSIQKKIIEYQRVQNELDKAKEELANLGDDASKKTIKDAEAKVDRLQRSADSAYSVISDTIDKINEDYLSQEGVEWQYGDPGELEAWQKQMNDNLKIIYDAQDRLAIGADDTGKAIESAFSRVSLQTEFQDELKKIQETSEITGEKLKEMYDTSKDTSDTGLRAFIQSLLDCGVIANTTSDELQKVVDLSIELGDNTSDAAVANKKLARSQKMLQYYKLYKELNSYTKKLKEAKGATNALSNEEKKQISLIRQKMQALAEEISKYDILGDQINEAKQAFESFENAKTADSNSDYLSSAGEMFKAVIDGFQSAELGSETFKAAFKGLIPESVYEDLDTLEAKYDAAAEYISGTLSRYFKIEYDDNGAIESVETTTKNIETFIEDAKEKGLMSFSDGVWTVNETDFSKFADKMGITESMLVAIGTQMDKIDADWITGDLTSFFDSFDMGTEANIYKAVKALGDLDQQLIDGKVSVDEYSQKYNELQDKLAEESQNALDNIVAYTDATNEVEAATQKVNEARDALNKLLNDPNATENEIQVATDQVTEATNALATAVAKKGELTEPSQIEIEAATQELESQMAAIKAKWEEDPAHLPVVLEDGKVNSKLLELGEDGKYKVALTPEVQDLSAEDQAVLNDYANLLNANEALKIYVEGDEDTKKQLEEVQNAADAVTKAIEAIPDPEIDTTAAKAAVNSLKRTCENFAAQNYDKTITVDVVYNDPGYSGGSTSGGGTSGATNADGTAHASGNWGLPQAEHNSLVGELGMETVRLIAVLIYLIAETS